MFWLTVVVCGIEISCTLSNFASNTPKNFEISFLEISIPFNDTFEISKGFDWIRKFVTAFLIQLKIRNSGLNPILFSRISRKNDCKLSAPSFWIFWKKIIPESSLPFAFVWNLSHYLFRMNIFDLFEKFPLVSSEIIILYKID